MGRLQKRMRLFCQLAPENTAINNRARVLLKTPPPPVNYYGALISRIAKKRPVWSTSVWLVTGCYYLQISPAPKRKRERERKYLHTVFYVFYNAIFSRGLRMYMQKYITFSPVPFFLWINFQFSLCCHLAKFVQRIMHVTPKGLSKFSRGLNFSDGYNYNPLPPHPPPSSLAAPSYFQHKYQVLIRC